MIGLLGLGKGLPEDLPVAGLQNYHPRTLYHSPEPRNAAGMPPRPLCSSLTPGSHCSVARQWKKADLAFYLLSSVPPSGSQAISRAIWGPPAPHGVHVRPRPEETWGPTSSP